jgi:hypothetical protein
MSTLKVLLGERLAVIKKKLNSFCWLAYLVKNNLYGNLSIFKY